MAYLIRSIIKFTFNKKIFTALILVIVIFSAVFTAFTVRLGTAFAYDGTKEGDHYKYVFYGDGNSKIDESEFSTYFEKYGYVKSKLSPADTEYGISYNGKEKTVFSFYIITDSKTLSQVPAAEEYVSAEDVEQGKKLIILSEALAEELGVTRSDCEIALNGVEYQVVAINDLTGEGGWDTGEFIAVASFDLALESDMKTCAVYLEKELSNSKLKKIASEAGATVNIPEKGKFITLFLILSIAVCALFAVNIAILFNAFISANDKYYAVFKILGISTSKLVPAMALPCALIALVGAAIGVGLDFGIASFSTILEKSVYLSAWGAVAVVAINVISAFIGAAVVCYRHAASMPADGLRRSE